MAKGIPSQPRPRRCHHLGFSCFLVVWMMGIFRAAALRAAYFQASLAAEPEGSKGLRRNPIAAVKGLRNKRAKSLRAGVRLKKRDFCPLNTEVNENN